MENILESTYQQYLVALAEWADKELGTNASIEAEDRLDKAVSAVIDAVGQYLGPGSPTQFDKRTELEKQALWSAQLILSYAPESAFANDAPNLYALLFANAERVMRAAGIEPEPNIRCWYWQVDAFISGRDNERHLVMARMASAPTLKDSLWRHPGDGHVLSESEFRVLWRN